jgi:hypothetical protein
MAEQKHVSGMTVGPLLAEEQHDAILETRERRKQAAQQGSAKRSGASSQKSGDTSDASKSKG